MLAAKVSLAARVDALGEDCGTAMGIENRAKLEMRLKSLEENQVNGNISCYLYGFPPLSLVTCFPALGIG